MQTANNHKTTSSEKSVFQSETFNKHDAGENSFDRTRHFIIAYLGLNIESDISRNGLSMAENMTRVFIDQLTNVN